LAAGEIETQYLGDISLVRWCIWGGLGHSI